MPALVAWHHILCLCRHCEIAGLSSTSLFRKVCSHFFTHDSNRSSRDEGCHSAHLPPLLCESTRVSFRRDNASTAAHFDLPIAGPQITMRRWEFL